MSNLILTLADEDGTLLDQTRVSRDELARAQKQAVYALAILQALAPGEAPPEQAPPGNRMARDGLDRCDCGSKYWENDQCIDCGSHVSEAMS